MKRQFTLFFLAFSIISFTIAQPAHFLQEIVQARSLVEKMKASSKVPGVSVTVMVSGEIVWSEGFGYADLEQMVPVDPALTKFRVGSISKPITSAALAKLYEMGKVDLDAPIQTYVPSFPKKQYDISLRQLCGHIAGIRHYKGNEFLSAKYYPTVLEGLDIFKSDPLIFEPGTNYSYSSYGWNLISAAIESIAQEDFLPFVQEQVFEALDLDHSFADQNAQLIPYRTRFYASNDNGEILNAPYVDNSYKWAGGGFISTSQDIARFAYAHLKAGYLQQTTIDLWIKPQIINDGQSIHYGLGWRSGVAEGIGNWYGHSGGSVGGISQMIIYPKEEVIVVMLTNSSNVNYKNTHHKIAKLFMRK